MTSHEEHYQTENIPSIEEQQIIFDDILEKDQRRNLFIDHIHYLYLNIIAEFRKGNHPNYNHCIFSGLTEEKFFEWIVENNAEIKEILC